MKQRILLQPTYVLHRRPYRETSFLIDLFTRDYGRLTVVANGVRKLKSATQGILQPFMPLLVSWSGKGELMTLTHVEAGANIGRLQGECLFAGFYLNELLVTLLQKWDAHPVLYDIYANTVSLLQTAKLEQKTLRIFEKHLLEELGYGLLPKSASALQQAFLPDSYYRFIPEQGFVLSDLGERSVAASDLFLGKSLLALANNDWQDATSLQDVKRLMRFVLAPMLGRRPIYSRQLFIQLGVQADETTK